jgi:RimJ/RimL family protein N-acetyltransferase
MCIIETRRVCLRPFEVADLDAYHAAIFADPDVMKYLPGGVPRPQVRTALERVMHF